tara:strand:- start:788 stop:1366 length:579 start_codon:yes stop_codon:yes gene_type:complete
MSTLNIKVSDKGAALIATLQKEIFNRRRKKVTAQGVVETLVESGAKSQSDKRYAASWKNLIKDIEKAAKAAEIHGNKPATISAEEWALIIASRTRKKTAALKKAAAKKKPAEIKATSKKAIAKKPTDKKPTTKKAAGKKITVKTAKVKLAVKKVASAQAKKTSSGKTSTTKRMPKAIVGRATKHARKSAATK